MDTTIKDLKVGTPLKLGKYGVKNENPLPIVWLKATPDCDFITENVIDYIRFDAGETGSYKYSGNPNYKLSNIFNFINSINEMWYFPQDSEDAPPEYKSHCGFLYHFEEYEIENLKATPVNVDGEQIISLIHLPSSLELFGEREQRFKLFYKKGLRAKGTPDVIESAGFDCRSFIPFWLRDRCSQRYASFLDAACQFSQASASNLCGLRPICTINPDTPVILGEDGYYYIKPRPIQRNVYTNEELFELLGLAQP